MAGEPHDLNQFEVRLRSVQPRPSRIDRDRLMFEAGQAAVNRMHATAARTWMWRAAAAILLLCTIVQSVRLQSARSPFVPAPGATPPPIAQTEQQVPSERPVPRQMVSQPHHLVAAPRESNPNLIVQRNRLLQFGVDAALPTPSHKGSGQQPALTLGQLRRVLLPVDRKQQSSVTSESLEPGDTHQL